MKRKEYNITLNINCIILSVVVVAILAILVIYWPVLKEFDSSALEAVKQLLRPYPPDIPKFVSEFGFANYLLWPLIAACCVLISHTKYLKTFMLILFTQGAFYLNNLIKNYVCRGENFTFPSLHCTVEMCFFGILIYLINRYAGNKFWRYSLISVFSIWLIVLSVSRMWLGTNYLTDIIAGLFLGFGLVHIYILLDKIISSR